jgi:uncharacterized repeat protein (TIGR01451 family)
MWQIITHRFILIAGLCAFFLHLNLGAVTLPPEVEARLQAGQPVDLIVEYDDREIAANAAAMRQRTRDNFDDPAILAYKVRQYKLLKSRVDAATARPGIMHLKDYSHLPMAFKRFASVADLRVFLAASGIKAVYANREFHHVTTQSLPLIKQPAVASAGEQGSGTTVAVIDNGIDYTRAAFGSCTAPGVPTSCRVVVSQNFGSGTTDTNHGTNVSAIVLGVAPASGIAMLNAFSGNSAYVSDIVDAINWAIANRAAYNIVAINMSLGDGTKYTKTCSANNPFLTPVTNARAAGMHVVVAAGNEAYTNGLSSPACTPGATSVGAVYDANIGGMSWGNNLCTDATTAADKITCFSNSASFLTLLAPGALISAAGITEGGTSQATPHVAGAIAVLRSTFSNESLDQIQTRMSSSGISITDTRNGISKPRLNLLEAARPRNDALANRTTLSGNSGSTSGITLLSTREAGEPNHAGNSGEKSVWWRWTAPAAGQLTLDTHDSSFDTVLAVYTGSSVSALTAVAANDNDGAATGASGLLLQAQAEKEYVIAVDGVSGAAGAAVVNWRLNTTANANLSAAIAGPEGVSPGVTAQYTITVSNAGPQNATNVWVTVTLPSGASYASGPASCSANGSTVRCFIGTMESAATVAVPIDITWDAIAGTASIAVAVSSDLPDTVSANNTATVQVGLESPDTDVPTLPQWGMLLMAMLLIGSIALKSKPGAA